MRVQVLERLPTFTPLGVRFWDPVLERPVTDGLEATARPWEAPLARPVRATRTLSGVMAFQGLPGLREVESRLAEAPPASPPVRRFVVEVRDRQRRYAAAAFAVELPLPYRGPLRLADAGSPADRPGFFLYSGPVRRPQPGFAVVRGELAVAATGRPAAHAVVEVEDPEGATWHGVADAEGRFAAILPWPAIEEVPAASPPASPPPGAAGSLASRHWTVAIRIRHDPAGLMPLPGSELPDFGAVLTQPEAPVWPADPTPASPPASPPPQPVAALLATLVYGEGLVARTAGLSTLLVGASPPSP